MLRLSTADYEALRRHGEETYPEECCGMLIGKCDGDVRSVRSTIRCTNTRTDSPETRYYIDPRELVRAQREANEHALEIVGFYHSHPDHPAQWSPTDLEEAHWIGCSYVITGVEKGKAMVTKSFALRGATEDDKFLMQEKLVVEDSLNPQTI